MPASPRYRVFSNRDSACAQVASEIALLIRERSILGRTTVLGLTAGKTPLPLYEELIYLHREEGLSFQNVITFNLDEYLGLDCTDPATLRSCMQRSLFDHIDIQPRNIHFLSSSVDDLQISAHCGSYERQIATAGGIDFQILGIAKNGSIGFIEPGTSPAARTQQVVIHEPIRRKAARAFGGIDKVPTHALTMGNGTILETRKIVALAWGSQKSVAVRKALEGPVTPMAGASYLKSHPAVRFFLDGPAASLLKHN